MEVMISLFHCPQGSSSTTRARKSIGSGIPISTLYRSCTILPISSMEKADIRALASRRSSRLYGLPADNTMLPAS